MNCFFRNPRQHAAVVFISFSLIYCFGLSMPSPANCENSIAEELISLEAKNQPLGEVLEDISAETGYQFRIDESWNDFPVTASIKNQPLHKGLKRILRNLNNAVIYGSDRTIRIKIYDQEKSSGYPAGQSIANRSYEETVHQPVMSENPRPPIPGTQFPNRKRLAQSDEQTSEENTESNPEPDEAGDKNEETEEQSGTADEEEVADSGPKSAENVSEEGEGQTAETDAASETASDSGAAVNE